MSYIRITRTQEVDQALHALRIQYSVLSEAEIIKLLLSEAYRDLLMKSPYYKLSPQEEDDVTHAKKELATSKKKPMSANEAITWLEEESNDESPPTKRTL